MDNCSPLVYPAKVPEKLIVVNEAKFTGPEKNVIGKENFLLNE